MNIPFKKNGKVTTFWLKEARERLVKAAENAEHADDGCAYLRIPVTLHDTVLDEEIFFESLSDAAWYLGITKGMASTAASKGRVVNGYLIIRHGTQSGKKIEQYDLNTGEVIKTYPTIESASKETGVNRSNIAATCRNERKSAGQYGWRFISEETKNNNNNEREE